MSRLSEAYMEVVKLKDLDTAPRFYQGKIPNQPMLSFIIVFARRNGEIYIHHVVYDDVWPQVIISKWGSLGVAVWREVRKLLRANLAFELFSAGQRVKSAAQAINFTNHVDEKRSEGFLKAAIQIIMEREDAKTIMRIA